MDKVFNNEKGEFKRPSAIFRNWISPDPNAEFPAEAGRYVLYINRGCPWAHRANIVHSLKHLAPLIELVVVGIHREEGRGWIFDGELGSLPADPLYGFSDMGSLYRKADASYPGRFTVPMLWDRQRETIVSNESADIIRMLATAFDHLLPQEARETNRAGGGLRPEGLTKEIDELNEWVYEDVNNGVYRAGFAGTQVAYDEAATRLFVALDRLEGHLRARGSKYLLGEHITEADVRLYTTLIRFDAAYVPIFHCNLKQIRYDYPLLHTWLRRLYWEEDEEARGAFRSTTFFSEIRIGYSLTSGGNGMVPIGPKEFILPLEATA